MTKAVYLHPRVATALADGAPVVALESTLLAHGLPYPDNLQLAHDLDRLIASEGAVPATIAVVRGQPTVGLSPDDLELITTMPDLPKLSIRDLPLAVATGRSGATTVASTAHLAALVGIRLFATGGLGGVHREARDSWDISADLLALQTTPVAVVCAGVKSLLDVPATLEYLETCGVPVVGYCTTRFPGFYRTDSGCALDWTVQTPTEAARVIRSLSALGLERRGLVLAHPLPVEEQLDGALHERVLAEGLAHARAAGVRGKAVTPYLLAHFHRQTGGASLAVNKRIVQHNTRLAAQVAAALAGLDSADADVGAG